MASIESDTQPASRTITITRVFDAPRPLVYRAWLEPEHLVHWCFASEGWTTPYAETDVRPGGAFRIGFQSPDRLNDFDFTGVYDEIVEPERLKFTIRMPEQAGAGDNRPVTLTFTEEQGMTKVTLELTLEDINSAEQQREGWTEMLVHLGEHLAQDNSIVMSRLVDAPRALVFAAFTDPQQIGRWWGPNGFTTTTHKMDVRVGGEWLFIMHGPDGVDYNNKIVYREIVKPERLVYDHSGDAGEGRFLASATFTEQGGKTRVTLALRFNTAEERNKTVVFGAIEGGLQTLGRLAEHLGTPLVITRMFDAPRELVFQAWTDPKLMAQWWGPKNYAAPSCRLDVRVGGKYLICMRGPDGADIWSTGTYLEVAPPERLEMTDSFADPQGNIVPAAYYGMPDLPVTFHITVAFEDVGGKTRMTLTHRGLPGGMGDSARTGWNESFDKLAAAVHGK